MFRRRSVRAAIGAAAAVCGLASALATTAYAQIRHYGDLGLPASAARITAGPDGALWFTLPQADRIGRITTAGAVTLFGVPAGSAPLDLASGPGGLWYTAPGRDAVGVVSTTGASSQFPAGRGSRPWSIAAGPRERVWFTRAGDGLIGRVEAGDEVEVEAYGSLPGASLPLGIAAGGDGAMWFSDAATA